jgi:inorganic pyrophosphatase
VKVYGAIALIDQGEMDWKLLGVNLNDPIATQLRGRSYEVGS